MGKMVYQFKPSAHIPKGVTPEGVMEERDRIEHDYGKATIGNSVDAVLSDPEKYPNLRAFGPADEADAMRRGIAAGIQLAYRAIIIERVEPKEKTGVRQIRIIHSVQDDDGDLVYKPIQAIRESPPERKWLITQLRKDAAVFAEKMRDVLAEIEEASLGRQGKARRGVVWLRAVRPGAAGVVGHGAVRPGWAWQPRSGKAAHGQAGLGPAGGVWPGIVRRGEARFGAAWQVWPGMAGRAGAAHGWARPGMARQSGCGNAWLREARRGRPGMARLGVAAQCGAGLGWAGVARYGEARLGWARRGSLGWARSGAAGLGMAGPGKAGQAW